jgi:hypothetical protein
LLVASLIFTEFLLVQGLCVALLVVSVASDKGTDVHVPHQDYPVKVQSAQTKQEEF